MVVAPYGFDLPRVRREAGAVLERLRSLSDRVLLLDGNAYLNRPGPRLVDAVEIIAAWLRGSPVPPGRGVAWVAGSSPDARAPERPSLVKPAPRCPREARS